MTYKNSATPLAKVNRELQQFPMLPSAASEISPVQKFQQKFIKGLSLKTKITLMAIALGIIPLGSIGAISYKVIQNHLIEQINQTQQGHASHMAQMLEKFLLNRTNEAETLALSPIFTNPNVMNTVTVAQKKAALNSFQTKTSFYDSIVYLDLQGNPLFQSQSERPLRPNYRQQQYFQTAITSKNTSLNELDISSYTGEPKIEFAVPVKHAWTDEVIGVMCFRIPSQKILPLFTEYSDDVQQWYVINTQGIFFANTLENLNNKPFANYFPQIQSAHAGRESATEIVNNPINSDRQQIINYEPIRIGTINPNLNLGLATTLDTDTAFAPLKTLQWVYVGGTIGTILLVGSIASFLSNQIMQPILKLTAVVNKLSQGQLNTRVKFQHHDELAILGDSINQMAGQLSNLVERQQALARTAELKARMAQALTVRELQLPFSLFLAEIRNFMQTDRVVFYQFDADWKGTIIAESVEDGFSSTLGAQFDDPCFAQDYVRKYQRGRIQAITNIHEANLTPCHIKQLEPYQVKASLVLPVILERPINSKSEKLIGLLIAHQCSRTRIWTQSSIDYLQQIACQLAMVLRGYIGHQEASIEQSNQQQDIAQIISLMKSITQGELNIDLTAKTKSASNVIKSFKILLHDLCQTIDKIKIPSQQINQRLNINQHDLMNLKDSLQQQANQLALIFAFIEQISDSMGEVSTQVKLASGTVGSIVTDLESEKAHFLSAIAFMAQLEMNLSDNQDKVKNLSAASQKMTRVINSIRKINLRASLLTSKLSKRIPELDESAFGLKEEIISIQQSIAATKELENIVSNIDREINQILQEYQKSETKLEQENYLVTNANNNLEKIIKMSKNAQQNLFYLLNLMKVQQQTSQKANHLITDLQTNAPNIMTLSDRTLESLAETAVTAQDLQNVADFFQLKPKKS